MRLTSCCSLFALLMAAKFTPQVQASSLDFNVNKQENISGEPLVSIKQNILSTDKVNPLVIMIRFADHIQHQLPSKGQLGGSDNVWGWIDVSQPQSYYVDESTDQIELSQVVNEVLDQLDPEIDFSRYDSDGDGRVDSVTFLYSGDNRRHRPVEHDNMPWLSAEGILIESYAMMAFAQAMGVCSHRCVEQTQQLAPEYIEAKLDIIEYGGKNNRQVELYWDDVLGNESQFIVERCKQLGKHKPCYFEPISNVAVGVAHYMDQPGVGQFKYRLRVLSIENSSTYSNEIEI